MIIMALNNNINNNKKGISKATYRGDTCNGNSVPERVFEHAGKQGKHLNVSMALQVGKPIHKR